MPKSRRYPITELPGTLQRSCREAQEMFLSELDDAIRAHGAGDQAHRIAYLALKQKFEKRGDHWIASALSRYPVPGFARVSPGSPAATSAGTASLGQHSLEAQRAAGRGERRAKREPTSGCAR